MMKKVLLVTGVFTVLIFAFNATRVEIENKVELKKLIGELQVKISDLQNQVDNLQKQIASIIAVKKAEEVWCHDFLVDLKKGDRGDEVKALQEVLAKEGFDIMVGEPVLDKFGKSTAQAVSDFQEKYKESILIPQQLENGTGYVGKATLAKLNELYGCTLPLHCGNGICESGGDCSADCSEDNLWTNPNKDVELHMLKVDDRYFKGVSGRNRTDCFPAEYSYKDIKFFIGDYTINRLRPRLDLTRDKKIAIPIPYLLRQGLADVYLLLGGNVSKSPLEQDENIPPASIKLTFKFIDADKEFAETRTLYAVVPEAEAAGRNYLSEYLSETNYVGQNPCDESKAMYVVKIVNPYPGGHLEKIILDDTLESSNPYTDVWAISFVDWSGQPAPWQWFENNIRNCGTYCKNRDYMRFSSPAGGNFYLDTGDGGYCGETGYIQKIEIPPNARYFEFEASAFKDYWGGVSGVKINNEWMQKFEGETGKQKTWNWQVYKADVSKYRDQAIEIMVFVKDEDRNSCDLPEHRLWLKARNFKLTNENGEIIKGIR